MVDVTIMSGLLKLGKNMVSFVLGCKSGLLSVPTSGALPISTTSLRGWWDYNNINGSPLYNDGTFGDPDSNVPGTSATAHISGARTSNVFSYNDAAWQDAPNNAISVGFWVYPTSVSGTQAIAGKAQSTAGNRQWEINRVTDTFDFITYDTSHNPATVTTASSFVTVNRWYYVGLTWESGRLEAFAGDELGNTESLVNNTIATNSLNTASTAALVFGDNQRYASFSGRFDEGYYFDRAFSSSEFTSLYNNGVGVTYDG
jgi:hypothetical protein